MELEIADAKLRAAGALVERVGCRRAYGLRHAGPSLRWTLLIGVTLVRMLRRNQYHEGERNRSESGGKPTHDLRGRAQHEQRRQSNLVVHEQNLRLIGWQL